MYKLIHQCVYTSAEESKYTLTYLCWKCLPALGAR